MTVLGPRPADWAGAIDAHSHLWIEPVPGAAPDSPVLNDAERILAEVRAYQAAGGSALIDCQPGGCGRNGNQLAWFARQSGLPLIGCTGFHRRRYYAPDSTLWTQPEAELTRRFVDELDPRLGMEEARARGTPVPAGFIKVAAEASLRETPTAALAAAALAAAETGVGVQIHTEKGAQAEVIVEFFLRRGAAPRQLLICHIDKRPDYGLHVALAQAGVLLEYDTFFRPKYDPEHTVWPLIDYMVAAGLDHAVALATDLADSAQWQQYGGGPGLAAFPRQIRARLAARGLPPTSLARLTGGNIIRLLAASRARPSTHPEE